MYWWILVLMVAVILLYGLFRWASTDARVDAESSQGASRTRHDWSGLRRSAIDDPDRQR